MKDVCSEKINCSLTPSCSEMSVKSVISKVNENVCISEQDHNKNEIHYEKKVASAISKEVKLRNGMPFCNKSTYNYKMTKHSLSKKRFAPTSSHMTNASAKVVLFERNVEIKDLESRVKYLQNKIKELENENKTLQGVQSRQERELKKFKEGVADIPSLLRSHKEEIKVYESTISNIRRELRDCQKEVKIRNESLLKKESQIDKLNVNLKRNEKMVHDFASEIKTLKALKKNLEEGNTALVETNGNMKNENDSLHKKIKELLSRIQNLEENVKKEQELNKQLKDNLRDVQDKYEVATQKIQNEQNINDSEIKIDIIKDDSNKPLTESLSEDGLKSESSKLEDLAIVQDDGKQNEIPTVKTKDALFHTFKCYQNLCNTQLSGVQLHSDVATFGTGVNNIKVLPPLKTASRKLSQTAFSDLESTEQFSSDMNVKDRTLYHQCEDLTKDFQYKLAVNDKGCEDFQNNTISTSHVQKSDNSIYFDVPVTDCSNHWKNHELINDVEFNMKTDFNEPENPENKMPISKNLLEKEKQSFFGDSLKDDSNYWQNKDLGGNVQSKLKITDNIGGNQMIISKDSLIDKHSYFDESLKDRSKFWQNEKKDFHYKSKPITFNENKPENKINFLKHPVKSKHSFNDTSKLNIKESHSEISWWDKW